MSLLNRTLSVNKDKRFEIIEKNLTSKVSQILQSIKTFEDAFEKGGYNNFSIHHKLEYKKYIKIIKKVELSLDNII